MSATSQSKNVTRREFLSWTAVATAGTYSALTNLSGCALAAGRRYNVLFIAVDDLRPELGVYGQKHIHTPHIDALAAGGTAFSRAYCQQAVCSPSRTSLMTGCRPGTTKIWDLHTHFRDNIPDVVTLGQHFMSYGYYVEGAGKIYHRSLNDPVTWTVPWKYSREPKGDLPTKPPGTQGYFSEKGRKVAREAVAAWKKKGKGESRPKGLPAWDEADVPDTAWADGLNALYTAQRIKELKKEGRPFFLACGLNKPHLPFAAPKRYWDLYDPAEIDLADNPFAPEGAPPFALHNSQELRRYHPIPKRGPIPDDMARRLIHGYYACTSYADANVGLMLKGLEESGLADTTIVILWGDHGWQLGEHGLWCKQTNFETSTLSPLIVRVPGQKAPGEVSDALVEFVDIYPTLAELCGLPLPGHLEGTSFAPLSDDPDRAWKSAAFSEFPRHSDKTGLMGYSMRTDRYRLTVWKTWPRRLSKKRKWIPVENADGTTWGKIEGVELYDHRRDPAENVNLAALPEKRKLVEELTAKLEAGWQAAGPPQRAPRG